jgi:hypothetical protein
VQRIKSLCIEHPDRIEVGIADDVKERTLRHIKNGGSRGKSGDTVGKVEFGGRTGRAAWTSNLGERREFVVGIEACTPVGKTARHFFDEGCETVLLAVLIDYVKYNTRYRVIVAIHGDSKVFGDEGVGCGGELRPLSNQKDRHFVRALNLYTTLVVGVRMTLHLPFDSLLHLTTSLRRGQDHAG